eukprot:IDg4807t1
MVKQRLTYRVPPPSRGRDRRCAERMKLRAAESMFRVAKSTIHRHAVKHRPAARPDDLPPCGRPGRPTAFSAAEEKVVVDLLCRFADRGIPLSRAHLKEAFALFIKRLPILRQVKLPFRGGQPGPKFLRGFTRRNKERLRFVRPLLQEGKRFAAVNAESITTHYATLEKLVADTGVDAARVWNLDEAGTRPGKDKDGGSRARRYLTRQSGGRDMRVGEFVRQQRTTVMPVVSAEGDIGPTLFVFKGTTLPYRQVKRGDNVVTETYADFLSREALMATREDCASVNAQNFMDWAQSFVAHVKPLTAGGRKVLLTYDAYRSHM